MGSETKKILVGIDFSKQSKEIFYYASSLAAKTDAKLIVLSVINQRDIEAAKVYARLVGTVTVSIEQFTTMEIDRRKTRIDEVLAEIGLGNLEKETIIRIGEPYKEILKAIKEFNIDLVVMGTRGKTQDKGYSVLTGSVAERIFKYSPVPVLSVRCA